MSKILCATYLLIAFLQTEPTETAPAASSPRALYQQAATAIAAADYPSAIAPLKQLCDDRESEYAGLAAVHLTEIYVAIGKTELALESIRACSAPADTAVTLSTTQANRLDEIEFAIAANQTSAPKRLKELSLLIDRLAQRRSATLDAEDAKLDALLASASLAISQIYQSQNEWESASKALDRCISWVAADAAEALVKRRDSTLPLAMARRHFVAGEFQACIACLQPVSLESVSQDEQVAAHFWLLESHMRLGAPAAAEAQSQWLEEHLAKSSELATWAPSLRLRQAELALQQRKYAVFQEIIQRASLEHADFERSYEFEFLQVRSAVARIEFQLAAQLLQKLTDEHASDSEPHARAQWMWGELELMQRHYEQAISHYQPAAQQTAHPLWQSCALLQMAKCQEMLGAQQAAINNYQRATEIADNPAAQREALARLAALKTLETEHR